MRTPGNDGACTQPLEVTRAAAWGNASKPGVVRASFRPTGNTGEYRYKISMNKLDVPPPQVEPLGRTIDDGTTWYEGSAVNCTERRKKLACRN